MAKPSTKAKPVSAKKEKKKKNSSSKISGDFFAIWYDDEVGMICAATASKKKLPSGWHVQKPHGLFLTHNEGEEVLFAEAQNMFLEQGFLQNKEFAKQIDEEIQDWYIANGKSPSSEEEEEEDDEIG